MNITRKGLLVVILLLCVAGGSLTTYGYLFAESETIHVDMQYAVNLSTLSVVDSTVTLNAAVTLNGSPVRTGINVDFYVSYNEGDWAWFASKATDANGLAQATYIVGGVGGYDFKTIVTVPDAVQP